MPDAIEVIPGRWANIQVLFDNGSYSAIWGDFIDKKNPPRAALGVRWNGASGKAGYPNQGGNPLWFVEPDYLIVPVLQGLLKELSQQAKSSQQATYIGRIEDLLKKLAD